VEESEISSTTLSLKKKKKESGGPAGKKEGAPHLYILRRRRGKKKKKKRPNAGHTRGKGGRMAATVSLNLTERREKNAISTFLRTPLTGGKRGRRHGQGTTTSSHCGT